MTRQIARVSNEARNRSIRGDDPHTDRAPGLSPYSGTQGVAVLHRVSFARGQRAGNSAQNTARKTQWQCGSQVL